MAMAGAVCRAPTTSPANTMQLLQPTTSSTRSTTYQVWASPHFQSPTPSMTLYEFVIRTSLMNRNESHRAIERAGRALHLACSRPGATRGSSRHNVSTRCIAGTSQRTGRWHTAAVHNVTAIVGAGVLGLPYAMAYLTWPGGVVVLLLSWTTSLYTLWQVGAPVCGMPGR